MQDRDLRYIWAYNQRTARQEDIIGKLDSDIFTPEEASHLTAVKQRVLEEDIELREQMWFNRPQGPIFLDICWEPIHDDTYQVIGVGTATVDLTEIKKAEEALGRYREELEIRVEERTSQLRESEETTRRQKREIEAYYDASPIGLCALDRNLRYLRINQRLAALNGRPASEHIGRSVRELLPSFLTHIVEPALREVIETGEPIRDMEFRGNAPGPEGIKGAWLQTINPLKDETGQVVGVTIALQDITELRRLEEQLRQAQKMEALGTLTGGIAHDFNNILAGIIGFTEMALDDDLPAGSPVRHHLELVLKAGFRGRDLIKQLLTFSRKTEYETGPLPLTPLLEETVKLLRASIPTTIDMDVKITAASDIVLANATGIHQIVMNLATNAAYAMRENGGRLSITLADADAGGSGLPPRRLPPADGTGYGDGHGRTSHGKDIRALLHNKRVGARHGHGTCRGLRDRQEPERRHYR